MIRSIYILFVVVCLVAGLTYFSLFRITQNLHEIDPGKFYRSAQMTRSELEEVVKKYGIKTVISLRGYPQPIHGDEPEEETLTRLGVGLQKYDLKTDYYPINRDIISIVDALKNAPKPILVHCRTGADRTGMISAIYKIEQMNSSKDEALKQLSFRYWHIESFHPAMKSFVSIYEGWAWLNTKYDHCAYDRSLIEKPNECP